MTSLPTPLPWNERFIALFQPTEIRNLFNYEHFLRAFKLDRRIGADSEKTEASFFTELFFSEKFIVSYLLANHRQATRTKKLLVRQDQSVQNSASFEPAQATKQHAVIKDIFYRNENVDLPLDSSGTLGYTREELEQEVQFLEKTHATVVAALHLNKMKVDLMISYLDTMIEKVSSTEVARLCSRLERKAAVSAKFCSGEDKPFVDYNKIVRELKTKSQKKAHHSRADRKRQNLHKTDGHQHDDL